jgi:hypothetical protein
VNIRGKKLQAENLSVLTNCTVVKEQTAKYRLKIANNVFKVLEKLEPFQRKKVKNVNNNYQITHNL